MLTTHELAATLSVGSHGTTYGGNPMAATVALTVLETINQPAFLARVKEAGATLRSTMEKLVADYPQVFAQVRGAGLLLGIVVTDAWKGRSKDIQKAAEANGMMVLIAGMDVVRLAPALIVSDAQIAEADRILRLSLDDLLKA
jgi:acetylornithine/N-succinyldiaminopimelate aminotransferase/succinylornithine aminotransferase